MNLGCVEQACTSKVAGGSVWNGNSLTHLVDQKKASRISTGLRGTVNDKHILTPPVKWRLASLPYISLGFLWLLLLEHVACFFYFDILLYLNWISQTLIHKIIYEVCSLCKFWFSLIYPKHSLCNLTVSGHCVGVVLILPRTVFIINCPWLNCIKWGGWRLLQ